LSFKATQNLAARRSMARGILSGGEYLNLKFHRFKIKGVDSGNESG
jgi:hypothetical protein